MQLNKKEKQEFKSFTQLKAEEQYGMYVTLRREINDLRCKFDIMEEKFNKILILNRK